MRKERRKKKEETKRRYEAIKDLMSTFAMSTVAVVAVVTLVPSSPKAEITKVVPLSDEIVYQVNVTDEDNALDLSTLSVVLENQLEFYEQPVGLGMQSGFFETLKANTQYRLSVYGNKGFGQERLDTLLITTKERIGGTIFSVTPDSVDFSSSYFVDVGVNDPDLKYTSVILYYGYNMHPGEELIYSSLDVTSSRITLELFDIFTEEDFHIYLEGTTIDGTELLDEIWVTPPFTLYASAYRNYTSSEEIGFFLYGDMNVENLSFKMNIYNNNLLVETINVPSSEGMHGDIELVVDDLSPNTLYMFECIAIYDHPKTLRQEEEIIYQEEITTLNAYTYSYVVEPFLDYIEVSISVNDPNHYFQEAYYELYDISGEFDSWLAGEIYFFTPNGEEKATVLTIFIPVSTSYRITIGMRNELDYSIKEIIEIIINE